VPLIEETLRVGTGKVSFAEQQGGAAIIILELGKGGRLHPGHIEPIEESKASRATKRKNGKVSKERATRKEC